MSIVGECNVNEWRSTPHQRIEKNVMSIDRNCHVSGYRGTPCQWIQRNVTSVDTEERHVSGYKGTSRQWIQRNAKSVDTKERHVSGYRGTPCQWIQRNVTSVDTEKRHVSGFRKTSCPQRKLAVTGLGLIRCLRHVSFYVGRGYENMKLNETGGQKSDSQNCWRNMQSYVLTYSKGKSEIALGSQQRHHKFCVHRGPQWDAREGPSHTRDTTVSLLTQLLGFPRGYQSSLSQQGLAVTVTVRTGRILHAKSGLHVTIKTTTEPQFTGQQPSKTDKMSVKAAWCFPRAVRCWHKTPTSQRGLKPLPSRPVRQQDCRLPSTQVLSHVTPSL